MANDKACQLLGYSSHDLIGQKLTRFFLKPDSHVVEALSEEHVEADGHAAVVFGMVVSAGLWAAGGSWSLSLRRAGGLLETESGLPSAQHSLTRAEAGPALGAPQARRFPTSLLILLCPVCVSSLALLAVSEGPWDRKVSRELWASPRVSNRDADGLNCVVDAEPWASGPETA